MNIEFADKKEALQIAKTLHHYFTLNSDVRKITVRKAYDILSEAEVIEICPRKLPDYKLQLFLNFLFDQNVLYEFIPQCRVDLNRKDEKTFYFVSEYEGIDEVLKEIALISTPELNEDLRQEIIETINSLPTTTLTDMRELYPRYLTKWTDKENELLLKSAVQCRDATYLSKFFGRQPSAIKKQLIKVFDLNIGFPY